MKEDVAEIKPVTEDVKRWKLLGIGDLGAIGIGGMVLGVAPLPMRSVDWAADHRKGMKTLAAS